MKKIFILPSCEHSIKKLTRAEKKQLAKGLETLNAFLSSGQFPVGFRFKKINHDKFEFRINVRLRVIVKIDDDNYYLVLAGNHDEVKRYLRNY